MKSLRDAFPAVAFGTSGVRALVSDLSAAAVSGYVSAFVRRLQATDRLADQMPVVIGIDLRPSSPRIASIICRSLFNLGYRVEYAGAVPTPALALRCLQEGAAGIMVTGSHIPFDRNGIKFYSSQGEILKEDETAIAGAVVADAASPAQGDLDELPTVIAAAAENYVQRYTNHFGSEALLGLRIGLYEHSAVGRDLTRRVLEGLGADVVCLARSDAFVPIDTEAVGEDDLARARQWCGEHRLDALVSTDGDGDRPLVFDERGEFVRGDLLGLVCARELGLRHLAVPVSCNTALEKCGAFERVLRTRIGSPYVIAGMNDLAALGGTGIAGFEANGGFLLGTSIGSLSALPTRDALLPMITILAVARRERKPVSGIVESLPRRFTHSDRIKEVPSAASSALLMRLAEDETARNRFFADAGEVVGIDTIDGLRLNFATGDIVHLRPSGNAPELRCYAEADSFECAFGLVDRYLSAARQEIV